MKVNVTIFPVVAANVVWRKVDAHAINGHNDRTYNDVPTADQCKQYCLDETGFECRSVDYDARSSRTCYLSTATQATVGADFSAQWTSFEYYDYTEDDGSDTEDATGG